jgi:hypothetical protein
VTDEIVEPSRPKDPFELEGIIAEAPEPPPWYKRVWVLVTGAVAIVVAASVIVDLPSHTTISSDIADQTSIMHTINTDVGGCAFAVQETFTIYQDMKTGQLSTSERSQAPTMLRDDQSACSFTNSDIFDLSNVETTGSPAGRNIGQVVSVSTLWVTSDALAAIEDVQNLFSNPGSASSLADLTKQEVQLAKDRAHADGFVQNADKILGANLPMPNLPSLPHLVGT